MKVLVTGFDPFGGEKVNPAWEAVKGLPDIIEEANIIKKEIPTAFRRSAKILEEEIRKHQPDIVLDVGQAGGRATVTVEKVAINLIEASIPDNDGESPQNVPVRMDGETAYFSTLPLKAMIAEGRKAGFPCGISYTAGTFVCNSVMYNALYLSKKKFPEMRAGFIHVPFSHMQAIDKRGNIASMAVRDMTRCLEVMIGAAIKGTEEPAEAEGTIQ